MNHHPYEFILVVLFSCLSVSAHDRQVIDLRNWDFSRDSIHWQSVRIPHDWAISGPFDKKWDLQRVAIVQNGEKKATEKSGRTGALPWIGDGYYRSTVCLKEAPQHAELLIDGAMSEPVIRVNGKYAGRWAYGYNAFRLDVSSLLRRGDNVIEIHLRNMEKSSRWYPGGGLYRPVKLLLTGKAHIDDWSVYVRTDTLTSQGAWLKVDMKAIGGGEVDAVGMDVINAEGKVVSQRLIGYEMALALSPKSKGDGITMEMLVKDPHLWSPETPYLYKLCLTLYKGRANKLQTLDEKTLTFGIRTVSFDHRGFLLNGQKRKIKGVCLHHDLGPLGAAVNKAALIRQVKILKDMGCDAIRTSHNMPSTMQMEVYDSLGMMVMAESFDMWRYPKCKNGYSRFFDEWADKDITNLILNHRNHPSVIMWSIGNEIPEQGSAEGVETARHLQELCHRLDPSRMVTQGISLVDNALKSGFAQVMDIPGFNYRVHKYLKGHDMLPQGFLLGSETASTVSSRGFYKFPVVLSNTTTYPDGQCNGYDTEYCGWSNLPETDFIMQDDYPWTIGQFVWTGFDYLGEPTPYDTYWPSRSSYFGICDLAGLPKDRYYLYRSVWNEKAHTVHLLPHWNWQGREGRVTPVYCYTDGERAELFVNGKSMGVRSKDRSVKAQDLNPDSVNVKPPLDRYRLRWNDVKYEPGELKVVAYDSLGNKIGEDVRYTSGAPVAIKMVPDRQILRSGSDDFAFITISLVDDKGHEVPNADDELTFSVEGEGSFRAVCNGDATSLEPFTKPQMKLFSGKVVVIIQADKGKGTIRLRVNDAERGIADSIEIKVL